MPAELNVECVGLHSIFLDHRAGTPHERHVIQCDLDSFKGLKDPQGFKAALQVPMRRFDVPEVHVLRTLKGLHVWSPYLLSRPDVERFESYLEGWGADALHGFLTYKNGGSVMRVTGKPSEPGGGPVYLRRVLNTTRNFSSREFRERQEWSAIHSDFMRDLHDRMPAPMQGTRNTDAKEVRLERYTTRAVLPDQEVLL